MSRATDITLRLYIPIYADNIMEFHYLKKDVTIDFFYEKFIFVKGLKNMGVFSTVLAQQIVIYKTCFHTTFFM